MALVFDAQLLAVFHGRRKVQRKGRVVADGPASIAGSARINRSAPAAVTARALLILAGAASRAVAARTLANGCTRRSALAVAGRAVLATGDHDRLIRAEGGFTHAQ